MRQGQRLVACERKNRGRGASVELHENACALCFREARQRACCLVLARHRREQTSAASATTKQETKPGFWDNNALGSLCRENSESYGRRDISTKQTSGCRAQGSAKHAPITPPTANETLTGQHCRLPHAATVLHLRLRRHGHYRGGLELGDVSHVRRRGSSPQLQHVASHVIDERRAHKGVLKAGIREGGHEEGGGGAGPRSGARRAACPNAVSQHQKSPR